MVSDKGRIKEYGGEVSNVEENEDIGEYEQCPFCELYFEVFRTEAGDLATLNDHIKKSHDKVRVRKGSNYRWVDRNEVVKNLAK
jgi:hypothetical protein